MSAAVEDHINETVNGVGVKLGKNWVKTSICCLSHPGQHLETILVQVPKSFFDIKRRLISGLSAPAMHSRNSFRSIIFARLCNVSISACGILILVVQEGGWEREGGKEGGEGRGR